MSPRRNWNPPILSAASVSSPLEPKEIHLIYIRGTDSPAGEGVGESQFVRLENSLTLCLLYDILYETVTEAKY